MDLQKMKHLSLNVICHNVVTFDTMICDNLLKKDRPVPDICNYSRIPYAVVTKEIMNVIDNILTVNN